MTDHHSALLEGAIHSNGYPNLTIIIEGINYGMNVSVILQDNADRRVGLTCLLPGWKPYARQKKTRKKTQLTQDQQIALAATQLKQYAQDLLNGDYKRFNLIGDRLNNMQKRFYAQLQNSSPDQDA